MTKLSIVLFLVSYCISIAESLFDKLKIDKSSVQLDVYTAKSYELQLLTTQIFC